MPANGQNHHDRHTTLIQSQGAIFSLYGLQERPEKKGAGVSGVYGQLSAAQEGTAAGSCPDDVLASWLRDVAAGERSGEHR